MDAILKALGLDQYQRAAQLQPALLSISPVTATCLLWAPKASALIGSLGSVVASAALLSLLMHFGRSRGRRVQVQLVSRLGGMPSTVMLRHRDDHIAEPLRLRYHAALRARGFQMPDAQGEAAEPAVADTFYAAATDWLPDQTRDQKKFYLLHVENRSYGFRRNLLGLKPVGLCLVAFCLVANGVMLGLLYRGDAARTTAGALLEGLMIAGLLSWVFIVTPQFVEDTGWG